MNFKKTNSIVSLYDDVQWHWYREDNKRPIHKNVNFLSSSSLFHAHKIFHSSAARDRATEMKGSRRIAWKSNSLFRGNLGCWLNKLGNNENPFIEPSRCFYYPRNFSTHNCYLWSRHTKKNPNARAEYQRRKKKNESEARRNINIDSHYSSTLIRIYPHITPHQQHSSRPPREQFGYPRPRAQQRNIHKKRRWID
jgi:hypothetical protein